MPPRKATPSRLPTPTSARSPQPVLQSLTPTPTPRTRLPRLSTGRPAFAELANNGTPTFAATPSKARPSAIAIRTHKPFTPKPGSKQCVPSSAPAKLRAPSAPMSAHSPIDTVTRQGENVSPSVQRATQMSSSRRTPRASHTRRTSIPKSPGSVFRKASLNRQFVFPQSSASPLRIAPVRSPNHLQLQGPAENAARPQVNRSTGLKRPSAIGVYRPSAAPALQFDMTNSASICMPQCDPESAPPTLLLPTLSFAALRNSSTTASFATSRFAPCASTFSLDRRARTHAGSYLLLPTPSFQALRRSSSGATVLSKFDTPLPNVRQQELVNSAPGTVDTVDVFSAGSTVEVNQCSTSPLGQVSEEKPDDSAPPPVADLPPVDIPQSHDINLDLASSNNTDNIGSSAQDVSNLLGPSQDQGLPSDMLETLNQLEDLAGVVKGLKKPELVTSSAVSTGAEMQGIDQDEKVECAQVTESQDSTSSVLTQVSPALTPATLVVKEDQSTLTAAAVSEPRAEGPAILSQAPEPTSTSKVPRLRRISPALGHGRPPTLVDAPASSVTAIPAVGDGLMLPPPLPLPRRTVSDQGSTGAIGQSGFPSRGSIAAASRSVLRSVMRPRHSEPPVPSLPSPHVPAKEPAHRGLKIPGWARRSEGSRTQTQK